MYRGKKAPAKTRHGLVIPPDPAHITPERAQYYGEKSKPDRHHVYFPRVAFEKAGELAMEFREHRFNSIWLPRFQHERLHRRYDRLARKHPTYMLPEGDVMTTFLDEAKLLDELDVCVQAVDMIDAALYEGRVRHVEKTMENRDLRIDTIGAIVELSSKFEVLPDYVAKTALRGASDYLERPAGVTTGSLQAPAAGIAA